MKTVFLGTYNIFEQIRENIEIFQNTNKISIKVYLYNDENEFLNQFCKHAWNVCFLDCDEISSNPIKLSLELNELNPNCKIILISKDEKLAVLGYKADICYYLVKPFGYEQFSYGLKKALKTFSYSAKYVIVNTNWQKVPLFVKDICFVEKQGHNLIIHTEKNLINTRLNLKDFMKLIKNFNCFVNCVRGTVVNLNWVETCENSSFVMKTGQKIAIRRQDRRKFKQIFLDHLTKSNNHSIDDIAK